MNNFRDQRDIEDDYDMVPMSIQDMNFYKKDLESETKMRKHLMECPFLEMMQNQMFHVLMNNMCHCMMPHFTRNDGNYMNNPRVEDYNNEQNYNQNNDPNNNENNDENMRLKKFEDKVDEILQELEQNNPEVYRKMKNYGIPYEEARKLTISIINIVLRYCLRKLDDLNEIKRNDKK